MLPILRLSGYFTIIFFLIMGLFYSQNFQPNAAAPYLYYFIVRKGVFITERADGTDRRILTSFQLPSPINAAGDGYLVGPGWSSSGNWFAWSHRLSNGISSTDAYIFSRDSNSQQHIIETNPDRESYRQLMIAQMRWHPTRDLLLIYMRIYASDYGEEYIRIYDPNLNQFIAVIDLYATVGYIQNVDNVFWSDDGQYITMWGRRTIDLFDLQGNYISSLPARPFQNIIDTVYNALTLIPAFRYYFQFTQYGERDIPNNSNEWHILVETEEGFGLSSVFVVRSDGTMRRRIATCPIDSQSCYGWLP